MLAFEELVSESEHLKPSSRTPLGDDASAVSSTSFSTSRNLKSWAEAEAEKNRIRSFPRAGNAKFVLRNSWVNSLGTSTFSRGGETVLAARRSSIGFLQEKSREGNRCRRKIRMPRDLFPCLSFEYYPQELKPRLIFLYPIHSICNCFSRFRGAIFPLFLVKKKNRTLRGA